MNCIIASFFYGAGDRTRGNYGVAAVESGGKRQSTGLSHLMGSSPDTYQ